MTIFTLTVGQRSPVCDGGLNSLQSSAAGVNVAQYTSRRSEKTL